jgi:hypothetical protein
MAGIREIDPTPDCPHWAGWRPMPITKAARRLNGHWLAGRAPKAAFATDRFWA